MIIAPGDFAANGKAWIEAVSATLNMAIAQFGILALAILAVRQNIRSRLLQEKLEETTRRLDRQAERIDNVALSVPATSGEATPVKVVNSPGEPAQVQEV